jgi:signal transduction histidine kinase/DNA-binding response OmpR family regulator
MLPILTVSVSYEQDVVQARQRARQIAKLLGFDAQQQTRLATAVSEIARNAYQYGGGGRVEFALEGDTAPQVLLIRVSDRGPGIQDLGPILEQNYSSKTGMGMGIVGARRLMDRFEIQSEAGQGTMVWMRKLLPRHVGLIRPEELAVVVTAGLCIRQPRSLLDELRQQNAELLTTLEELLERQDELARLNRELEDTNRGVVALYAELDERADHLRRADEVKTRFLSNMTHEFRTPLNSIQALTRLLLDRVDGDLSPEQERQVHFIRKAAESLSELVNDLLDLAKVAAGKIVVRPAEFEVGSLFGALRGMLRPLLLNTSVNLVFEEPDGLPTLQTDEAKVSQILRNFISNGLKFTEAGEVRVSARLAPGGRDVIFSVADTGIGIAEEDQSTIFQEFVQIENPLQRRVNGSGLGLPLSKKLAELLGGSVSVKSVSGEGSTFSATIPVVYAASPGSADVIVAPELDRDRASVLLIEDEMEARLLYEKYMRGSRFQTVAARNTREARSLLQNNPPAAIILDMSLPTANPPDGNAWELLVELKTRTETRGIPVIAISDAEEREKVIALGAEAFGRKPLERRWLLGRLTALTGRLSPRKVLVIDDDEVSRYLIRQAFSALPVEVIEASNGVEGVRYAREEQPNMIVLDLLMPEVNGFQVLEQLQADARTSYIPVIVSTSRLLDEVDRRRLERWSTKLLPKSTLSDGTAVGELQRLCAEIGLGESCPEPGETPGREALPQ